MFPNLLLVVGAFVLCFALRSLHHPLPHKIGTLGIPVASFLAGWLLGGSVLLGILLGAAWLFIPWLEILTHVRRMRLPINRSLIPRSPPSRHHFPGLEELTGEIEAEGFEFVADTGWEHEDHSHYYRLFHHPDKHLQAAICLVEQSGVAFYYLSVSARLADDESVEYLTWNHPFSTGLQPAPNLRLNRSDGEGGFDEILASHGEFLDIHGVTPERIARIAPGALVPAIERDMRRHLEHNLDNGLLVRDGEKFIRYSVRGMFFLWFQFLRDLVKIQ